MTDAARNSDSYLPKFRMTAEELFDALLDRLLAEAGQDSAWLEIVRLDVREDQCITGRVVDFQGNLLVDAGVILTCKQGEYPLEVGQMLRLWRDEAGKAHLDGCLGLG